MELSVALKLIHVSLAFAFVAGIIGRSIVLGRAKQANDLAQAMTLADAAGPFDRIVIASSILVLPAGFATAWAQGYAWLGLTTGWMLASVLLYVAISALVPTIFLPSGKRFSAAMADAQQYGTVTPRLRAAFADPAVRFAHAAEAVGLAIIVVLMVVKPF